MDKEKQIAEMASDINDCITEFVTDTGDVYIDDEATAQKMFDKGYRKQSENSVEVVRCYDCKYCEFVIDSIIDEPRYFCTRMVGSIPIDPTDYCSQAKMKGGEE